MLIIYVAHDCGYFNAELDDQNTNSFVEQVPPILVGAIIHHIGVAVAKKSLLDANRRVCTYCLYTYECIWILYDLFLTFFCK
jgi:hypothetical protein